MPILVDVRMPMEIGHIMIMIFMLFVENNSEVAGIDAGFADTSDLNGKSFQRQSLQHFLQRGRVGAKIEQSRYRHISADAA